MLNLPFLYISDCRGYATFFWGIVLYHLLSRADKKNEKFLRNTSALIVVSTLFLIAVSRHFNWYLWVYIVCPSILVCGVMFPQIQIKKAATFSEITFQMYLWHVPCFYVFQFVLDIFKINFLHSVFSMLAVTLCCFVISVLVYQYVDLPISKIVKKRRI